MSYSRSDTRAAARPEGRGVVSGGETTHRTVLWTMIMGAILASGVVLAGVLGTAPAGAATFGPVADTYVSASSPDANYGTNPQLRVDGTPLLTSYLRFDVQGVVAPVTSATLRIFANSNHAVGMEVRAVSDNAWQESGSGGITYNSQPSVSSTATATTGAIAAGTWQELDVTSLLSGSGLHSFALTTPSPTAMSLASKESSNPPQLIVLSGSETPPPTASPTPTAPPTPTPAPTASPTPGSTPPPGIGATLVADSSVKSASPTSNYGSDTQLRADASPELNSYLRFNVQGLNGVVSMATLRLFANSNHSVGLDVRGVDDNTWTEDGITFENAPGFSPSVTDSSGPLVSGTWYDLDVTSLVTGNGLFSFALTTAHTTAFSVGSKESATPPALQVLTGGATPPPTPPPSPSPVPTPTASGAPTPPPSGRVTVITRVDSTYFADALWTGGNDYSGSSLKNVGEAAIYDMNSAGGGLVQFEAGDFDLGTGDFHLRNIANIVFAGRGIDVTTIRNDTSVSADTEPWNMGHTNFVTIRDMTVHAAGAFRSTSDAIDFDDGNYSLVERVKITSSRARGIIFDGKGPGGAADYNVVRDCVITSGVPSDGIELLASNNNRIEGCTITGVGGHGIQITKASTSAAQPNKKSNDNVVTGNIIQGVVQDGVDVVSSDRNKITGNAISLNGRDGTRIDASSGVTCDQNEVSTNTFIQNNNWGLNIDDPLCNGTIVQGNVYSVNGSGAYRNNGTGTVNN